MIILHTDRWEQFRKLTNGERRGVWAAKYYGLNHHRKPPRIRIRRKRTVNQTTGESGCTPCP